MIDDEKLAFILSDDELILARRRFLRVDLGFSPLEAAKVCAANGPEPGNYVRLPGSGLHIITSSCTLQPVFKLTDREAQKMRRDKTRWLLT